MVGQTRGAPRPNMAPPRTFQATSPPPSDPIAGRGTTMAPQPSEPESTPEASNYSASSDTNIADDEAKSLSATTESLTVQKPSPQANSNQCYTNQKLLDSKPSNVKMLNSEVPQYIKKMPQIGNSQILSILPSGKTVENVKQVDSNKQEVYSGTNAKRSENQPNFITMQQKINEKLLANQIPIQRLPEQQFILKQVGSSDNIVTMTTAKIPEPNQNYFAMVTNKPQGNYVNYLSLPVNQQNFIAVDQQQKNNFVVMEAQHKTNFVTVPQKPNVQTPGQTYLVHGNGTDLKQFNSYLAVTTKPGDTNGTTFFTMTPTKQTGPQTAYLMTPKQAENSRTFVAVAQKPSEATYLALPAGKNNDNNKTATFIAMEPNKTDTNIIVTQVLPTSQPSPQLFQLEYAENDGKGKYFNPRDNSVVQPVVPKMSCSAISSSSVMSTKPALTNTLPPLTSVSSVTPSKRSTTTTKVLASPGKTNVPPLATSGNISFISTSGNVTFLSNSNESTEPETKTEIPNPQPQQELAPSPSLPPPPPPPPVNTVLSSNVPQAHQYLIPNVDSLKLAADNINKMLPPQGLPPPGAPKPLKLHQSADSNFQMHNYSKNDSYPNHASKTNLQDNARRKYGQHENNKLSGKNSMKFTNNMYSNHQKNEKNQGSLKSRIMESRPTNHQRMPDGKNPEVKTYSNKPDVKKEVKIEESTDVDVDDTKIKREEDDEEEGVEVRPVFDMRIPLVFQVVLTDHCYGMPLLLLRDEKPLHVEDDKESVISSDGKGEDGEETETANEGEDSVTRCICDLEHDDGYMVCCDKCSVWQHVACVFPDVRVGTPLPEEYLCDACHPRKLDRNRARALQLQRRKQIFNNSDSSDSSSSSLEIAPRTNKPGPGPKKAVARRRAEPVSRKPMKLNKSDPSHNDGPVKPAVAKAKRRDSSLKPTPSVGKRAKLKKKLETKMRPPLRRKHLQTKNKEISKPDRDISSQKDRIEKNESSEEPNRKSPDLRTRLQMLKSSSPKELGIKPSSRVRCRLSHLPAGEAVLLASCSLTRGQLICEIRGKYLLSEEHPGKSECLFFYRFPKDGSEVVVDAAGYENLARYARRSCRPNSQLKHCLVKGSLRLYLIAKEDMGKNQEITIGHNIINDSTSQKEGCVFRSKDCPYALHKNSQNTSSTERRRRGRRRTVSEESEGSPVKNKKETTNKVQVEPPRRNSSMTQSSRSPSSPIQTEPREKDKDKDRKLTREEKKIEQAMKIFAQMERDTARKKDKDRPHMPISNSGGRKDSQISSKADSDKESPGESNKPRRRRRRRRRKSRKSRLSCGANAGASGQFNSGDSDLSSADELPSPRRKTSSKDSRDDDFMRSPIDKLSSPRHDRTRRDSCNSNRSDKEKRHDAAGLLLALGSGRYLAGQKTPTKDKESENEGSPPTPLSSACLLVAAAVGPLASGFKFPKTKKGLMNEWLSKSPEHSNQQDFSPTTDLPPPNAQIESTLPPGAPKLSNLSNRLFSFPVADKSLELKVDPVKDPRLVFDGRMSSGTPAGFGKKRWLRQAISEECDAPHSQGSPPCPPDNVTPLKKRRLARESLSSDPPTTPPMPPITSQARDERIYSGEMNSPESPTIIDTETEISLAERVDALRREYLEAQERNLLKSYEEEKQSRQTEENENYERFNNYDSSPQRVPENLSYRFQESEYYNQEQNENSEKPLDLTGEKDEGESEDANTENEKTESSPKGFKKVRGRKTGSKKSDNEVRSSPRFRKSGKSRKNENLSNNNIEIDEKDIKMEIEIEQEREIKIEQESEGDTQSQSQSQPQARPSTPPLPPPPPKQEATTPQSSPEKNAPEKVIVNRDPRLRDVQLKSELFNRTEVVNDVKEEQGVREVQTKAELKGDWETKPIDVVDSYRWNQDFKNESNDRINQNGLENVKREDCFKDRDHFKMFRGRNDNVPDSGSESHGESRNDDGDQYSTGNADKIAPAKRKLSITEYLKRKKSVPASTNKTSPASQIPEEDTNTATGTPEASSPQGSPPSDEDRSRVTIPTPALTPVFLDMDKSLDKPGSNVRFKSEPTELERQRENLTERLRREFGLLITDDDPKSNKTETEEASLPIGPQNCPFPGFSAESDYLDPIGKRPFYHPPTQTSLPQSAIYPVGSSNPPNPSCVFNSPYPPIPPPPPPSHDESRKDKKMKKFKQ